MRTYAHAHLRTVSLRTLSPAQCHWHKTVILRTLSRRTTPCGQYKNKNISMCASVLRSLLLLLDVDGLARLKRHRSGVLEDQIHLGGRHALDATETVRHAADPPAAPTARRL